MFCVRCGAASAEGSRFCTKCGAAMGAQAGPTGSGAPPAPPGQQAAPSYIPSNLPPQAVGPAESSGKAIGSLICGFLFVFFPAAIVAIVLGHLALSDIRKSAGRLTGHGMAIAGLVLGYMGVVLIPFILIVAAIVIPNLLKSRMAANEASAVESLRSIDEANAVYAATYDNGFAPELWTLGRQTDDTKVGSKGDCYRANLLDVDSLLSVKNGYVFTYAVAPGPRILSQKAASLGCAAAGSTVGFTADAFPAVPGATGQRSFFTDASGVIRFENDRRATADSPPLE